MLGDKCQYDKGFICFKWGKCTHDSILSCLKISVVAQAREIESLKHRQMLKHTDASIKWRTQAFNYKKKCKTLELWIMDRGMSSPNTEELVEFSHRLAEKEVKDDKGLRSVDKNKGGRKRLPIRPKKITGGGGRPRKHIIQEAPVRHGSGG